MLYFPYQGGVEMARRARLDMAGFHHIVNRGVARSKVYRSDEDKEKE